jgi:MoaA/NifB/PqqE/SkfB family radical SAM enzyme
MNSPRKLNIDLSYACNLNCTTCRCPDIDRDTGAPLLSLERVREVIDQFAAAGGESVGLLGGEPLLVGYVYDVVKHAADAGLPVSITTNAMPATLYNSRRLLANGLSRATVSLDGDQTGHESIRGTGTFEKTLRGAKNLMTAAGELGRGDFRLGLHVTISRANVRSFAGVVQSAAEISPCVGVSVQYLSRLEPGLSRDMERLLRQPADHRRNHWNLPRDLLLTDDDIPALGAGIAEMKQAARERNVSLHIDPALDEALDAGRLVEGTFALSKPCGVFETALLIGPDGTAGSCPMLTHFSFGNVHTQSLPEIWAGAPFEQPRRALRSGYLPVCQSCCRHGDLM